MESISPEELARKGITDIQRLIIPIEGKTYSELWHSWHFLQVYSVWGLRLPCDEIELKSELSINNPAEYTFFDLMVSGNKQVKTLCQFFQRTIFPELMAIARSILRFATTSTPAGEDFFSVILEQIELKNFSDALEVLQELRELSRMNLEQAKKGETNLATFYSDLISAQSTLKRCHNEIDKDAKTSMETINKLQGDENQEGSIANIRKTMNSLLDEYNKAKVIAWTTLSYAWIVPFGLIAGGVVAGLYGSRATALLQQYEAVRAEVKKNCAELHSALATRDVLKNADDQLNYILDATQKAIGHTEVVKKSWKEIVKNLEDLSIKVSAMIKSTDEGEVLKIKIIILPYIKEAKIAWSSLIPPLTDLLVDPYIKVEEGKKTPGQLADDIERHLNNPPNK